MISSNLSSRILIRGVSRKFAAHFLEVSAVEFVDPLVSSNGFQITRSSDVPITRFPPLPPVAALQLLPLEEISLLPLVALD